MYGPGIIAPVHMADRIQRNQSIEALSRMSFGVLATFLDRLKRYGEISVSKELGTRHIALASEADALKIVPADISLVERPPMRTIPEYLAKFYPGGKA